MNLPGLMASVEGIMQELGNRSQSRASELKALYLSGDLARDDFVDLLAEVIAEHNAEGVIKGRAVLGDYLEQPTAAQKVAEAPAVAADVPAEHKGLTVATNASVERHYVKSDRLRKAITTILDTGQVEGERVERLAHTEPIESVQKGFQSSMTESKSVMGWVRQLDADPCELCTWWERDGQTWPADHQMPTHPGCACIPVPVVRD